MGDISLTIPFRDFGILARLAKSSLLKHANVYKIRAHSTAEIHSALLEVQVFPNVYYTVVGHIRCEVTTNAPAPRPLKKSRGPVPNLTAQ